MFLKLILKGKNKQVEVVRDDVGLEKINKGYFRKNTLFLYAVLPWLNGMRERKPKLLDARKH